MPIQPNPSYRFEFYGGLSNRGVVERTSQAIDKGWPHRIQYWLNDLPITGAIGRSLPSNVADLLDVALAVYIADRLAPRAVENDLRSVSSRWHRRFHLVIPVRVPDEWTRREVLAYLEKLLPFVSDDAWTFEFVHREHAPRPAETQTFLLPPQIRAVAVTLSSDGLDSLCGISRLLMNGAVDVVVPVTVATNPRIRARVAAINHEIRKVVAPNEPILIPVQSWTRISSVGQPRNDRESTQRTRGLYFLATGVATAALAGTDRLQVCENGIGAIGLSMTADHWGSRATKSMHPRTLKSFGDLASIVLNRAVTIENLGLFSSKGQLVKQLPPRLIAAARQTRSCDRTVYLRQGEACGKCTQCLLRRVALNAANLETAVDGLNLNYLTDWMDSSTPWDTQHATQIVAMWNQVETIRQAIESAKGLAGLDREFPDLFDVTISAPSLGYPQVEVESRLVRLYQTYVGEFEAFMQRIHGPDWSRAAIVTDLVTSSTATIAG